MPDGPPYKVGSTADGVLTIGKEETWGKCFHSESYSRDGDD